MRIKLLGHTDVDSMDLAKYAAKICYSNVEPKLGKVKLDVRKQLFDPGHHTTLEHFSMNFDIRKISVGDVTFGLHLTHPFYNADQQSGRFAAKMFVSPEFGAMMTYVERFWPEVDIKTMLKVMEYIANGIRLYSENMPEAQKIVERFIKEERPKATRSVMDNISKYAQEQMRMFISVIFPTSLIYTIDLITLVSMYRSAWTPALRYVTGEMARLFVEKFPEVELGFLFSEESRGDTDWAITCDKVTKTGSPNLWDFKTFGDFEEDFVIPTPDMMHPVDLLHFDPVMMENSILRMMMQIEISVATMGQDQRHRTVNRGIPWFTGKFCIPPILRELGLQDAGIDYMKQWVNLSKIIPGTLTMILAPYGAMVSYKKSGSVNAITHEMCKRLCWNTQGEIYDLARQQRIAMQAKFGKDSELLKIFQPVCFETGECGEGDRYCGRDIGLRKKKEKYFVERGV